MARRLEAADMSRGSDSDAVEVAGTQIRMLLKVVETRSQP